jgi:cell division protein FtsA
VKAEISRNGFEEKISAGIVFTGGTSKMEGVVELS